MLNTLLLAGLLTVLTTPSTAGGDLKVIAHPDVAITEISAADLRSVFLGTKTSLKDGRPVAPVLEKRGPLLAAFSRDYLGKTDAALETYYLSLVFAGKWSMPPAFSTDEEVIAYVARTRGAIGFVHETTASPGVKTLPVR